MKYLSLNSVLSFLLIMTSLLFQSSFNYVNLNRDDVMLNIYFLIFWKYMTFQAFNLCNHLSQVYLNCNPLSLWKQRGGKCFFYHCICLLSRRWYLQDLSLSPWFEEYKWKEYWTCDIKSWKKAFYCFLRTPLQEKKSYKSIFFTWPPTIP